MKVRNNTKKMLSRILAMTLAVAVAIPTNFAPAVYAAEPNPDVSYNSDEADNNNAGIAGAETNIEI